MTIYLYIKQCTHCGLKYFGKTTNENPYYLGSGKYWLRHLKLHGRKNIINIEIYTFDNENEAKAFALMFSEYNCIVESKLWANIIIENAVDGAPTGHKGHIFTFEQKQKMSDSGKNKWKKENIRNSIIEAQKKAANTPERLQKSSEIAKKQWNEDRRKKQSEIMTGRKSHTKGKKLGKRPHTSSKISNATKGKPKIRISRISDKKEMSVNYYTRWLKSIDQDILANNPSK